MRRAYFKMPDLRHIVVNDNQLVGTLHAADFMPTNIEVYNVAGNQIEGGCLASLTSRS